MAEWACWPHVKKKKKKKKRKKEEKKEKRKEKKKERKNQFGDRKKGQGGRGRGKGRGGVDVISWRSFLAWKSCIAFLGSARLSDPRISLPPPSPITNFCSIIL